jgi:hypothetical protein
MAANGDGWRPAARPPRSEGGGGRGQLIYDYGAIAAAASTGADGHTASLGHILLASATSKKALLDAALRRAVTAWCKPLKEDGFAKIVRIRRSAAPLPLPLAGGVQLLLHYLVSLTCGATQRRSRLRSARLPRCACPSGAVLYTNTVNSDRSTAPTGPPQTVGRRSSHCRRRPSAAAQLAASSSHCTPSARRWCLALPTAPHQTVCKIRADRALR